MDVICGGLLVRNLGPRFKVDCRLAVSPPHFLPGAARFDPSQRGVLPAVDKDGFQWAIKSSSIRRATMSRIVLAALQPHNKGITNALRNPAD